MVGKATDSMMDMRDGICACTLGESGSYPGIGRRAKHGWALL